MSDAKKGSPFVRTLLQAALVVVAALLAVVEACRYAGSTSWIPANTDTVSAGLAGVVVLLAVLGFAKR
jgi:hypothetical protein